MANQPVNTFQLLCSIVHASYVQEEDISPGYVPVDFRVSLRQQISLRFFPMVFDKIPTHFIATSFCKKNMSTDPALNDI